jgi:micrococcal nuclease
VARVVDGDTIEILPVIDGVEEVSLIGVDTPETKDPDEGVEPYGPEASDFATDELTGWWVGLEFDVERIDQYDRILAYVYVGGEMFNEELVEEGYAQAYPYPPNTKYEDRFAEAQEEARAGGLGIWGLSLEQQCQLADHGNDVGEGYVGCKAVSEPAPAPPSGDLDCSDFSSQLEAQETLANDPTDPNGLDVDSDGQACETSSFGGDSTASPSSSATAPATASASPAAGGGAVPPISEDHCPSNAPIKGNESSGIYHMPGDAYYDATYPEVCFAAPQDAEAAG